MAASDNYYTKSASAAATSGYGGGEKLDSMEMFSFTFNPELMNLFWGLYRGASNSSSNGSPAADILSGGGVDIPAVPDDILPNAFLIEPILNPIPSTTSQYYLFGFQLPIRADDSLTQNVLTILRHSAITTGIVILVGVGSYCTYYSLQKLRNISNNKGAEAAEDCHKIVASSSTSSTSTTNDSYWPVRVFNKYWLRQPAITGNKKPATKNGDCVLKPTATATKKHKSKTQRKIDIKNMEAIRQNLNLDLETWKSKTMVELGNAAADAAENNPALIGEEENFQAQMLRMAQDKKRKGHHRRHEAEHFSPSPVLSSSSTSMKGDFPKLISSSDVQKGRILVGGGDEGCFGNEDEEFQIEYFGPASPSSSSTLSDDDDDDDDEAPHSDTGIDVMYRPGSKNSLRANKIQQPGSNLQAMISPSHNPAVSAATVRRQLDFGDVSPIPTATAAPLSSQSFQYQHHTHHYLTPLSASSSMELSPTTTPTTTVTAAAALVTNSSTPVPLDFYSTNATAAAAVSAFAPATAAVMPRHK